MTVLLLEDEHVASQHLTDLLARHRPDAHVLTTLRSVHEATDWFAAGYALPDLIFSDIELLDGNVFAFYDAVQVRCPIIFTTAYDQFLLRAFQTNSIAYLLKPFDDQTFTAALSKYDTLRNTFRLGEQVGLSAGVLAQLRDAMQPIRQTYKQRFTVKMRQGIYLLPTNQITYLQADDSLVFAFDATGQRYPLNGTLTEIEQQLDPARFFRINRGELIAIDQIDRLEPYLGDRLAIRLRGVSTPFISSAAKTPELRKWLER
jgi:two-component system, LytTR family, response regulator LytT